MSAIDGLRSNINSILSIRDSLGATKAPVFIVTRTWSGSEPGDGSYKDSETAVLPSPSIATYFDDIRIKEGGAIQQGDLKLKWISKQSFPEKSSVDGSSNSQKSEKFYKVGEDLFRVIQIEEKLLCWNVLLRRVNG